MKSFLVQCIYQDGDRCEWPRFIVLGDRSIILADRMIEYAESISLTGWKSDPCAIETRTFDPDTWLDCQENELYPEEVFVAISGPLDAKDESLLERATKIGARCFIVVDAETSIRPNWQSVVRLPPHRSWDAQWAWGIRVFLDVLLEGVAHRGVICTDPMDILTCLSGRLCQLAVFHAEGEGRAVTAVDKAVQSLSGRINLAGADAFVLSFHMGADFRMKEIHQGLETLKEAVDRDKTTIMATHVFTDGARFAISLIAATPLVDRKIQETDGRLPC
jgi:hypothetical protein